MKWQILWYSINTILLLCLYFWMLFTVGNIPMLNTKISEVENKVNEIDYHINHTNDTIVVIYDTN